MNIKKIFPIKLKHLFFIVPIIIIIIAALLFTCCSKVEKPYPVIENNKVGDLYEVHSTLYGTKGDDKMLKFGSWFLQSDSDRNTYCIFEKGTIFEITRIKKITHSSWNTGTYSFPVLKLKAMTGEWEGEIFNANHIMNSNEIGVDLGLPILEKVSPSKALEFKKLKDL